MKIVKSSIIAIVVRSRQQKTLNIQLSSFNSSFWLIMSVLTKFSDLESVLSFSNKNLRSRLTLNILKLCIQRLTLPLFIIRIFLLFRSTKAFIIGISSSIVDASKSKTIIILAFRSILFKPIRNWL